MWLIDSWMEQQRSEQDSSVGDALALALRCACFCSASLILFVLYWLVPLLIRPRHFARSCAVPMTVGMLKSLREALRVFCIASSDHYGSVCPFVVFHRGFSLANVPQASWWHALSILTVPVSEEYVRYASLPFSGLLCLESCLAT